MWELSVQVTDGAEGTGIDRITLKQGNGTVSTSLATSNSTMNTSLAAGNMNITLVSYNASCCSPDVDLLVVDRVGNVGSCFYSIRRTATNNSSQVNTTSSPQTTPETPTPTAETPASTAETPTPAPAVSSSTKTVQSLLFCFSLMIVGLNSAFKWG